MSRIGYRELIIPEKVTVEVDNKIVTVKGPKGELTHTIPSNITLKIDENKLTVQRENENQETKALHGTTNSLIENMMIGVSAGYEKGIEIVGVGFRFNLQGSKIVINAGFSHQVTMEIPKNLTVEAISNTELLIKGIDKQAVGEFAAVIRKVRKPEPYKGKGIRYKGEKIRRKEGKKAAK